MTLWQWWFIFIMLVSGTVNTLSKKIQNDSKAPGLANTLHYFDHPWFQTFVMFLGECTCLIMLWFIKWRDKRRRNVVSEQTPLLDESVSKEPIDEKDDDVSLPEISAKDKKKGPNWKVYYGLSCMDLFGTTLAGLGLIYTYASVFQMLRGSIVVFSGTFSVLFLKRKLKLRNWLGIFIVTVGLFLVGLSDVLSEENTKDPSMLILGDAFVLSGQVVNAAQFVLEEKYLKSYTIPPLKVVGMEGIFGSLTTGLFVLPLLYFVPGIGGARHFEDSVDAMAMIGQNSLLAVMVVLYWISIAFYNYSGLSVVRTLSTVHRTLVDALRTLFVWSMDLLLFYTTSGVFGEPISWYWWVQAIGFLGLIVGTLMYQNKEK